MPPFGTPYALQATHALSSRSWEVRSQDSSRLYGEGAEDRPRDDGTDAHLAWTTRRELDHAGGEIGERVVERGTGRECCILQPVKGWYLLITSSAPAFRLAQASSSSQSTTSYVNLVPSRTDPATHFAFKLRHARDITARDKSSSNASASNKRKSYVVVDTKTDTDDNSATMLEKSTATSQPRGSLETKTAQTGSHSITTSSFLLRPISHSAAKAHIHSHRQGHAGDVGADGHLPPPAKRISLRGLASLFTAQDNSFELLWEDHDTGTYLPILVYEDHPSLLRTDTAGQLHMREELIATEFQMPSAPFMQDEGGRVGQSGDNLQHDFDPLTFFVTVGIAYLGFLEDQEAYKAASQG